MKKTLLAVLCVLGLSSGSAFCQQETMPKSNQTPHKFERKITKTVSADYLLFLPEGYKKDQAKKWPLMLFLHGAGERGTNLSAVAVHGPPKIVKNRPDFPFIVVSPQCASGARWNNDVLLGLLDEVIAHHNVDTNRIYLTGLSMGGFGTWSLGLAYPEKFAAIAPICGGGDSIGVLLADGARREALKTLPIWAFHGGKDNVVNVEESERMVKALKKLQNEPKLTIYPEAGHDSWTETYNNQELYDWFLKHEKTAQKKQVGK